MSDRELSGLWWWFAAAVLIGGLCGCRTAVPSIILPPTQTSVPLPLAPLPDEVAPLTFMADGDLYVLQPRDTVPRALIASPAYESMPAWSPDGTYLAYVATEEDTRNSSSRWWMGLTSPGRSM